MNIITNPQFFTEKAIAAAEKHYNAKFIFESCLPSRDGSWANLPVAIFYQEIAHPKGSNYFGLYFNHNNDIMICNAIKATQPFEAVMLSNGDVHYSRFRHDYRMIGEVSIDGGRDYTKIGYPEGDMPKIVKLHVVKDKVVPYED